MKKILKKKEGFTLVELIVVIAILAILAAVAIPAYTGYISKAKDAADLQQLDAIKTAAVFVFTEASIPDDPAEIESITVAAANGTISGVTVNTTSLDNDDVKALLGGDYPTLGGSYKNGATWYKEAATGEGAHPAGWN